MVADRCLTCAHLSTKERRCLKGQTFSDGCKLHRDWNLEEDDHADTEHEQDRKETQK